MPHLVGDGTLEADSLGSLALTQAQPFSSVLLALGLQAGLVPTKGGVLVPFPIVGLFTLVADGSGGFTLPFQWPAGVPPGTTLALQAWSADPGAVASFSASNGITGTTP